ncbi:uncharacterized protein LOC132751338 isoform X2 [Ruditapes philippinarum]|uniref:uncharacterized protein LOC132751338 isoform X2 n=1 Tax=Ruditapes philippinarum TaxID=129788 RepID=UPI00295B2C18|nr:uncharacterized protein LOC132751338 isoform X2 [Ruditapes philippinarum]
MSEEISSVGAFVSPIEQAGNYFIMDTEQVISNPYQDLQSEALDSAKKSSLTERLTAVRNNVCEHNLRTATNHLEKQRTHSMRNLHMDTSNLRYQVKIMDIDRRKNDLALQKRINPKKDFSYDNRQISTSAKRLGITSEESFYLDRKLQYPLRGNILKDHNAKPLIKKARKTMADYSIRKKNEQNESERAQTAITLERATTAHTVSTTMEILSPEPSSKDQRKMRYGSKSAPPPKLSVSDPQRSHSRLSAIDETDAKLPNIRTPSVSNVTPRQPKSHVKFNVTRSQPFRQSTPEKLYRSKTWMPRVTRSYSEGWDSDDDDDYLYSEKVDLRALFFGNKSQSGDAKSAISGISTAHTSTTRMSGEIPIQFRAPQAKPKVTEEMLLKEQKQIKDKIDSFLGTMKKDEQADKKKEEKEEPKETEEDKAKKETLSKAAILLSVFSKPLDRSKTWGFAPPRQEKKVEKVEKVTKVEIEKPIEEDDATPKNPKDFWKLIKTNIQNGNVKKRKYTANDLLLQQLTGILVHADQKTNIPINAASRALRHTPTFKMRRVVEELMRQRTRYEQQEIDKLQQQENNLDGGVPFTEESGVQHYPTRAWGTQAQEMEQPS